MYQTLKCIQRLLYEDIKLPYQKSVFWKFFSVLGNKTINNKEITLYENRKQIAENVFFLCFTKKNANLLISRNKKKHYQKNIFWVFLSLLPTKNAKIDVKHSILKNKRTLQEKCIMSFFIVQKNQKAKNTKTRVYGEGS